MHKVVQSSAILVNYVVCCTIMYYISNNLLCNISWIVGLQLLQWTEFIWRDDFILEDTFEEIVTFQKDDEWKKKWRYTDNKMRFNLYSIEV